jgi:hypothetical protein
MENTNEFMDEVLKHTDKLGHLCSENNKILNYYKISIKEIIKIINVNSIDTNKITIERYNFEKIVKELDRKNHRKHIVFVKNEIKKMIPQWFKKCIKNILKHGHGT